jgi:glucose/arabinose dehydrogenase
MMTFIAIILFVAALVLIVVVVKPSLFDNIFNNDQKIERAQQQQQLQADNENKTKTRVYGCAEFGELFHCDPFQNELVTYKMVGNWSIISPVVNDNPRYVSIGKGGGEGAKGANHSQQNNKALEISEKSREFVQVPNEKAYSSEQFSVLFNIYKTNSSSTGQVISHVNKEQTAGWFFDIRPPGPSSPSYQDPKMTTGHTLAFGVSKSSGEPVITKRVSLSKSTNLAGTFDGTSLKLYKDGLLIDAVEYDGKYKSDPKIPIHIGSGAWCSSCNRWGGVINDVRIYNESLSQNEIKNTVLGTSGSSSFSFSNFSSGSSDTKAMLSSNSSTRRLVGHWPLNGNLNDMSGLNNHGQMITPLGSMAFAPDGRLFYTEKNTGEIKILKDNKTLPEPFSTVRDIYVDWEQGLLGIAIDPNYQSNKFVYAYYTTVKDKSSSPYNRVVRFTDHNNSGTDMQVLLDNIPASRGYHSGGALAFGPDDKLYITVGDATEHEYAQDPSTLLGKVLRINKDGTIPKDNPFPNSPVYTLGHRNMYGIAFDWSTGVGILTENGDQVYDEVNLIEKGGNYGFPSDQPANIPPELSNSSESIKPLRSYFRVLAPTQAIYYAGDKYPHLHGKFLFGTYTGSIYALTVQKVGTQNQLLEEDHIRLVIVPFHPVNGIAQSSDGDIYFGGFSIFKLDVVDVAQKIQDTFPIVLTSSSDVILNDVQGSNDADYLYADLKIDQNATTNSSQPSVVTFKIPTIFLPGILSMTYTTTDGEKVPADFNIDDSNPAYTVTRVQLPQNITDTQLFINGSSKRISTQTDFGNGTSRVMVVSTNATGAVVNYSLPSSMQNIEGPLIPICGPPSGSAFPIGDTKVKCIATDKAANNTVIETFIVRVIDGKSH